jgi:hypothetical protein
LLVRSVDVLFGDDGCGGGNNSFESTTKSSGAEFNNI